MNSVRNCAFSCSLNCSNSHFIVKDVLCDYNTVGIVEFGWVNSVICGEALAGMVVVIGVNSGEEVGELGSDNGRIEFGIRIRLEKKYAVKGGLDVWMG